MKLVSTKLIRNALIVAAPFFAQNVLAGDFGLDCKVISPNSGVGWSYSAVTGEQMLTPGGGATVIVCDASPFNSPVTSSEPQPRKVTLTAFLARNGSKPTPSMPPKCNLFLSNGGGRYVNSGPIYLAPENEYLFGYVLDRSVHPNGVEVTAPDSWFTNAPNLRYKTSLVCHDIGVNISLSNFFTKYVQ